MSIRSLIATCTALLLCGTASPQDTLSVQQYRNAVIQYSHALRIARAQTLSAEEQQRLSRTGLLPRLDASGIFSADLRRHDGIKPFAFSLQPAIVQTIYAGGGARAAYRSDMLAADIALCEEYFTTTEIIYAADYAYWNLAASIGSFSVAQRYVDIIRSLKQVIDARFADGYISKSDVLMIDARLGEAEYGLVAASLHYQKALHNFNILMGDTLSAASLPADSIMTAVALPARIGHAEILDRRSDYTAAMLRTEQAAWDIRSARAKYLPQISLGATGTWQTRSPNSKWATTLDGMAYISLDIPVFHWGARNRTVAIARQAKEIRQFEAQQLRDRIFLEEADAWSAVQNSLQQTVTSYRSLETARENLQLSTYSYNEGQLSILDVLSAQLSWLQLYENAIAAALGLHLSVADYNRITSSE